MPALLRLLDPRRDVAHLARLDLSYTSPQILSVRRCARGFDLVEVQASPPVEGRHAVDGEELASCNHALVAEVAGNVVGVAALRVSAWNRRGIVAHLYVDRPFRGRGIGAQFIEALVREGVARGVRSLWVETQNVNLGAIRFYEACGFVVCGLDVSLYDPAMVHDETAIFLERVIEAHLPRECE